MMRRSSIMRKIFAFRNIGGDSKKCIGICAKWSELVQIIKIKGVQRSSRAKDKHMYQPNLLHFFMNPTVSHATLCYFSFLCVLLTPYLGAIAQTPPFAPPLLHVSSLLPMPHAPFSSYIHLLLSHFASYGCRYALSISLLNFRGCGEQESQVVLCRTTAGTEPSLHQRASISPLKNDVLESCD